MNARDADRARRCSRSSRSASSSASIRSARSSTRLGRPDRAFPSIIVAGTNGKGSVTAMIERGLARGGLPHRPLHVTAPRRPRRAVRHRRRADLGGRARYDRPRACSTPRRHLPAPPSFFEATTAIALEVFREAEVDVAVLEVGLGGRLDATNVVDADRRPSSRRSTSTTSSTSAHARGHRAREGRRHQAWRHRGARGESARGGRGRRGGVWRGGARRSSGFETPSSADVRHGGRTGAI